MPFRCALQGDRWWLPLSEYVADETSRGEGGPVFEKGSHDLNPDRFDARWRISAITFTQLWSSGNKEIMRLARQRGAARR